MVMASARKKLPVTPVMDTKGRNTTIGVMVEPINGTVISRSAIAWGAAWDFWRGSCNTDGRKRRAKLPSTRSPLCW